MQQMRSNVYTTRGGVTVYRASIGVDGTGSREDLVSQLNSRQGVLLSSSYEFPGRYQRWDLGFSAPPLRISSHGRQVCCQALNARGELLLLLLQATFTQDADIVGLECGQDYLNFTVAEPEPVRFEEERTRQRSVFSVLRTLLDLFASGDDAFLGLYGAFGYELAFQFEPVVLRRERQADNKDMVLYLPDSLLVVDHRREQAQQHYYDFDFSLNGRHYSTRDLPRRIAETPFNKKSADTGVHCDHEPGQYEAVVTKALLAFSRGDLFEVVPGQTFTTACRDTPADIFRRLQSQNPAPFGALMNLGCEEYLVAASPEMYVRVDGNEVETCPISGTIGRGTDALEDAEQIRKLLNSAKDEAELSMCTDVDRNDKSRICVPGSVKVTGRRLLEMYSRLFHTVDQVKGVLKPCMDALDAFLTHAWAVTVTGAPKHAAIQFIEDNEASVRHWYGGAIGCMHFNGNLNTGLTIRTIRIKQGMAEIRAGATLLSDSDPKAEEAETRLKASALLRAVLELPAPDKDSLHSSTGMEAGLFAGKTILMVDHQDSFVHTLSSYLQESGATVHTVRPEAVACNLVTLAPQLVVLSPGPGKPSEHGLMETIRLVQASGIPLFGVCLGLQGIVEYFGGTLKQLATPMHGKQSHLCQLIGPMFQGLGRELVVGRYHSLVADRLPECLNVVARSDDGEVMAVQHKSKPVLAVQFHPESILSARGGTGRALLMNLLQFVLATQSPEVEQLNA